MGRSWLRRAAMVVAFAVSVVLVGSGSAGPRLASATFEVFPGPGKVTYGELIAYKGTFTTRSGSTLTHVRFRQTVPTWAGGTATFDSSTCPSTPTTRTTSTGTELICDFGQVPPGTPKLEVIVVWRVPPTGATTNCNNCLVSTGKWTVKEGINDTTDPNDIFGLTETKATLLGAGANSAETLLAGGYETAGASCSDVSSSGNLATQGVVSLSNPLVTKFCLPPLTLSPGLGHASTITELNGNARHAEVCIAALGTNCGTSYIDATFAAPGVTLIFQVADGALPKGYKIEAVSHNGDPALKEGECSANGDCVVLIDLDNRTKIWTIIVTSTKNGFYDF